MSEPMITIKKADGTFAKVPLSELKKIQAAQKPTETAASQKPVAPAAHPVVKHHAPVAHHVIKHHPVHVKEGKKVGVHHAKPMTRADAGSPLEEKLRIKSSAPLFSPKRENQVEDVVVKLGFSVTPDILGRLKGLVLAKLKDIKSEEEVRELAVRAKENGGLGLTEQQVNKIIQSCREINDLENKADTEVPVLKGKSSGAALMVEPLELPAVPSAVAPVPYNKISSIKPAPSPVVSNVARQEVVSQLVKNSIGNEPIFKLDTKPVSKPSMQDVTASSMEMGPVEEIKSVTLADFRRLSGNPEDAAKRLRQKMFNLQDESFVWYLEALAAYHVSPLYSEYMQAVCQSLAERKSLANVLSMKNSIKLNEAVALMEMERGL